MVAGARTKPIEPKGDSITWFDHPYTQNAGGNRGIERTNPNCEGCTIG